MAHPHHHAISSARKWGGAPEDYLAIHQWFDASKAYLADVRHRALRHHTEGIFACEKEFGPTILNQDGREIPVRFIGEQHVKEDLGRIPSLQDWLTEMPLQAWMARSKPLSKELEHEHGQEQSNPA